MDIQSKSQNNQDQIDQNGQELLKKRNKYNDDTKRFLITTVLYNVIIVLGLIGYYYFSNLENGRKTIEDMLIEEKNRQLVPLGEGDYNIQYYQRLELETNEELNVNEMYVEQNFDQYPPQKKQKSSISPSALEAIKILRRTDQIQWYIIPMLAFVVYIYAQEIYNQNWNFIACGLYLFAADWRGEIMNEVIFHITGYSSLWNAPGNGTSLLIFIGLNIEIAFMFCILGIIISKTVPKDRDLQIFGINNRKFIAVCWGLLCAIVEYFLHNIGALGWEFGFQKAHPLIWPAILVVLYSLTNYEMFRMNDMHNINDKFTVIGIYWALNAYINLIFWLICL